MTDLAEMALDRVDGLPSNLTLAQAATALGVTRDVMRAGIAAGTLPGKKVGERSYVIPRIAIVAFLLTGRMPEPRAAA